MNSREQNQKAATISAYGALLGRYMQGMKSAAFVVHPMNPDPLGIKGLGQVPIAWIEEMEIPGFIVERVGRSGIRIW